MDEINKEETLKIYRDKREIRNGCLEKKRKNPKIKFWLTLFESKNFIIISG